MFSRVCDRCGERVLPVREDALGTAVIKFVDNRRVQEMDLCGKCTRIVYQFVKNKAEVKS